MINLQRLWNILLTILIKLSGIDWSLLSLPSYTYTHCFLLIGAKIKNKINVLKKEKKNRLFCFKLFQIYSSTIRFRGAYEFF